MYTEYDQGKITADRFIDRIESVSFTLLDLVVDTLASHNYKDFLSPQTLLAFLEVFTTLKCF